MGGLKESASSCASRVTGTSKPRTTPYFSLCSSMVDAFIMSRLLIGPILIAEYLTFWLLKYSSNASNEPRVEACTYTPSECSLILFKACEISLKSHFSSFFHSMNYLSSKSLKYSTSSSLLAMYSGRPASARSISSPRPTILIPVAPFTLVCLTHCCFTRRSLFAGGV